MNRTLNIPGYTVTRVDIAQDTTMQLAYQLTGPRGAHFDVLRDTRNGNLWAINLKRSGYIPAALSGNLKNHEVEA